MSYKDTTINKLTEAHPSHTLHGMANVKRIRKTIWIRPMHFSELKRIARREGRYLQSMMEIAIEELIEKRKRERRQTVESLNEE